MINGEYGAIFLSLLRDQLWPGVEVPDWILPIGQIDLFENSCSIGLVGRVFTNGPGDLCSISGNVIPKTLKMVLNVS